MFYVHCTFNQSWSFWLLNDLTIIMNIFEKKKAKFDIQFITLQDIVFPRQYMIKIVNAVFVGIICIFVCRSSIIYESFECPSQLDIFPKDTSRKLVVIMNSMNT